ncbi:MAG: MATE family efflux transporter, partial [Clostridia bacterium]|nr:MATE family efflux transporter [Clostridia bacterium]
MSSLNKRGIMDMTTGPFLKKILIFAVPLMITGVLQLIYNAADVMVVGRFAGSESLAAVGSTSSLINLIINIFIGLSTGSGVVTARSIGEEDTQKIKRCVHTAMATSLASGIAVGLFGFLFASKFLSLMGTPDDVLPLASLYLKIYFLGAPGSLIFNFGASILRATGDTKRPLIILSLTGLVNVVLNLVLVVVFHLNVAGVAIATIVAQYLSAIFIVTRLLSLENACRLKLKKIRIHKAELKDIIKIGLPAGLQNSLFSLSNVLIQSTINSFGSAVMAGNTAAQNADAIIYTCTNAVAQTSMTFTSQNMGAKKHKNISKVYFICLALGFGISVVMGALGLIFPEQIIGIFTTEAEVIEWGVQRLNVLMVSYFLCSMMDISGCQLRGMGKSLEPMIISLIGACGIRTLWLYT